MPLLVISKLKKVLCILWLLPLVHGCAYLQDRGRDATDVVTASIETGYANASLQIGKGTLGIGLTEGRGFGSRSGALGAYDYAEANLLLFGSKILIPNEDDILRGKGYDYTYTWQPWLSEDEELQNEITEGAGFNFWQVELAATLGLGARLGFNIAEFTDLVLGLFTVDLLGDDISNIEKPKQER